MKFLTGFVAISAAISQALAIELTNSNYDITEGEPFTITWSDADGDVTLLLKDGPSNNLGTIATIASGVSGSSSFTWTPSDIASGTYAIEITDDSGTNYSPQFSYAGNAAATATTTGSSTSSTASSTTGTTTGTSSSSSGTLSSSTTSSVSSSTVTGSANSTSTQSSSTLSSSTGTSSSTRTSTSSSSSSTSTIVNTNDSKKLGSPLALILLTAAALFICN